MLKWLKNIFTKKQKPTNDLSLTNQQFAILQRLSGYFIHQEEAVKIAFPEIHSELKKFYNESGFGWEWFPKGNVLDHEQLKAKVESHPSFFEIDGEVTGSKNGKLHYTFHGYAAVMSEQKAYRRGKVFVERIDDNLNEDDYLNELSNM